MWAQGTGQITELFWQHWDDAVNKIHRVRTQQGFLIHGRAWPHIMTDVSDVYTHFDVSIFKRTKRKCVVKIFGIKGVNRKSQDIAKITALSHFLRIEFKTNLFCFVHHSIGKNRINPLIVKNRKHFGFVVA